MNKRISQSLNGHDCEIRESIPRIPEAAFKQSLFADFVTTATQLLRTPSVNSQSADGDRNGTDGRRVKITARSFNPGDDQCPESAD